MGVSISSLSIAERKYFAMKIGCVKEIKAFEFRVGLTPGNVEEYVSHGHKVCIESSAGEGSSFTDGEYAAAGAAVVNNAKYIWNSCDMIIKVKEPLEAEYSLIRSGQILFTYLHLAANRALTEAVVKSGCTGVAYETIEDRSGDLPLLRPMSEIAGRLSIQEGAKYLEKPFGGRGVLLGGVPGVRNAKVVILGAGIVGKNACKMAVGIGADVTVLDINIDRLRYLDDLYSGCIKTLYSTPQVIKSEVSSADLVIGAVLIHGASAPKLVKKEYLKDMMPGSVIVDVAVDQGGCFETTKPTYHNDPVFVVDGVVHYCVANMPGAVPRTSTIALTNATLPYGLAIADKGVEALAAANEGIKKGINCYGGALTYDKVAESFGMKAQMLNF